MTTRIGSSLESCRRSSTAAAGGGSDVAEVLVPSHRRVSQIDRS